MDYEAMMKTYYRALAICDPIDFQKRQQDLLYALAQYLLERDKPGVEIDMKKMPKKEETPLRRVRPLEDKKPKAVEKPKKMKKVC